MNVLLLLLLLLLLALLSLKFCMKLPLGFCSSRFHQRLPAPDHVLGERSHLLVASRRLAAHAIDRLANPGRLQYALGHGLLGEFL